MKLRWHIAATLAMVIATAARAEEPHEPPSLNRLLARLQALETARAPIAPLTPKRGGLFHDDMGDSHRDELIAEITKYLPRTGTAVAAVKFNPDEHAGLRFTLADAWQEKSRRAWFDVVLPAHEKAEAQWRACTSAKSHKACGPKPRIDMRRSDELHAQAIAQYKRLLQESPESPWSEEARFALTHDERKQISPDVGRSPSLPQQMRGTFGCIELHGEALAVFEIPKTECDADTLLAKGTWDLDHNDLEHATRAFEDALSKHVPETDSQALYWLGWCRLMAGDAAGAVQKLEEAIAQAHRMKGDTTNPRTAYLNDLVFAFTRKDSLQPAITYFTAEAGNDGAIPLIERLADGFFDAGGSQYDSAITTYRWLLQQRPTHADAPEWQTRIVVAVHQKGNLSPVRTELTALLQNYARGSVWWQANEEGRGRARSLLQEALADLAGEYRTHPSKSVGRYSFARDLHRMYLVEFPDTPEAHELRFAYAEILMTLEDYHPAYDAFRAVAEDAVIPQLRTQAVAGMLHAAEMVVLIDDGPRANFRSAEQRVEELQTRPGEQLTAHERQLLDAWKLQHTP